jgi:hypothetical protein
MSASQPQSKYVRRTKDQINEMNEFFVEAVQKDKALLFDPLSPSITAAKKDEK